MGVFLAIEDRRKK